MPYAPFVRLWWMLLVCACWWSQAGFAQTLTVLIRYPAAFYFFVSRQRTDLARDLERGLDKAVREGQLQAPFEQHLGPALKTLNLAQRRVIEVPNPLLPPGTPLTRAELWYRP